MWNVIFGSTIFHHPVLHATLCYRNGRTIFRAIKDGGLHIHSNVKIGRAAWIGRIGYNLGEVEFPAPGYVFIYQTMKPLLGDGSSRRYLQQRLLGRGSVVVAQLNCGNRSEWVGLSPSGPVSTFKVTRLAFLTFSEGPVRINSARAKVGSRIWVLLRSVAPNLPPDDRDAVKRHHL